jgi:GAF domain-containing protein
VRGEAVINASLDGSRWPEWAAHARRAGFRTVHAVPMRHDGEVIGALNIFHTGERRLSRADADVVQALADMTTIAILNHRALHRAADVADQLQRALQSRVTVEQAKGMLAERLGIPLETAFELIRHYARNGNHHITDVSQHVIDGRLTADRLLRCARSLNDG